MVIKSELVFNNNCIFCATFILFQDFFLTLLFILQNSKISTFKISKSMLKKERDRQTERDKLWRREVCWEFLLIVPDDMFHKHSLSLTKSLIKSLLQRKTRYTCSKYEMHACTSLVNIGIPHRMRLPWRTPLGFFPQKFYREIIYIHYYISLKCTVWFDLP